MSTTLFSSLAHGLSTLLDPLARCAGDPQALNRLLSEVGVTPLPDNSALLAVVNAVAALKGGIDAIDAAADPSFAGIARVLDAARSALLAIRRLEQADASLGPLQGLGEDLTTLLLVGSLERRAPVLRHAAALLTLLDPAEEQPPAPPVIGNGRLLRDSYRVEHFHFDRLPGLLRNPVATLQATYGDNLATQAAADAMADKLFPRLMRLLRSLGIRCRYGFHPDDQDYMGGAAALTQRALIVYADDPLGGLSAGAGLVLALSGGGQGALGLVVSPFGTLSAERAAGAWRVTFDLTAGLQAFAWGPHGLTLLAAPGTVDATGRIAATLAAAPEQPACVVGPPDGSRLELGSVRFALETQLSAAHQAVTLSAQVSSSALVVAPGDSDGFLGSLLPARGLRADFDLGLLWSSDTGLHLQGSAGLEATVPVNLSAAGLSLHTLHLGLRAGDGDVSAEVSAGLSATLGPVKAALDRVGVEAVLEFPAGGGNLGPADLAIGFKPPSGIGLTVDAQGVLTGGGFLFRDEAQGLYAGAMQLSLHERITLKAFGLVATRLPDGSRGYSLLVFITAEDFQPVPLGLGFTLLGIGGLVGVNRSFDQDVMRQGLKNGTLGALLFPRDPVGNAPALIRALAAAFPARPGSHLLGLLARIGWFTPTLVLMDLALVLEFGSRTRLLALGRISALLPSAGNDLVRLNMEAMGVIDFDAGTAAVDAVLVDSRLAHKFAITGSAALRAGFASGPSFVLAVGGLNPHFAPPAGFPALDRVAIALSAGSNPRLVCDAYFAITSNTVQFGAHAALHASAAGFSVEGDVGFDVLVQLAPLHFIADYHARLQLKRGSCNLFMVEVAGELEGPRPLRLSGKASFKIFWFHFSVHFDATLVSGEPPPLPSAVDVLAQLKQALAAPSAWRIERSADHPHGVALRSLPASAGLVLDPLGRLAITQQVVPLNTARDIDTFGGAPVLGARRFAVTASLNGAPLSSTAQAASFAPAQYFSMTDDEKLAAPAFETLDAGCVFGSNATALDATQSVAAPLAYRTVVMGEPAPPAPYVLPAGQLPVLGRSGAAARAPVRRVGRARFRNTAAPAATLQRLQWVITPNTGGAPLPALAAGTATWSELNATLSTLNRGKALYQLLPAHELLA